MTLPDEVQVWVNKLNKEIGPGTIVRASDIVIPKRFSTGSLAADVALGGGLPGNQWIEVVGVESSGKTYFVLKTIAANQKADKEFMTFWVAGEHYDTDQAIALGVDNERVVVAPAAQKMEVALDLLLDAAESQIYDCLVLDSYPSLLPDEEAEKAMNEAVMATGAKLFNKFWRKAGQSSQRNTDGSDRPFIGIVINQFRDKIGCINYQGKVNTVSGTERIGKLVNQGTETSVYSYDETSGKVLQVPIVQWHNNGPVDADGWVKVTFRSHRRGKSTSVVCTPDHRICTPGGWVRAQELRQGDEVLTLANAVMTPVQRSVFYGGLIGDSCKIRDEGRRPAVRIRHGGKQHDYVLWKHAVYGSLVSGPVTPAANGSYGFGVRPLPETFEVIRDYFSDALTARASKFTENLDALALAVWYMDDGSICAKRTPGERQAAKFASMGLSDAMISALRALLEDRYGRCARHPDNSLRLGARDGGSFRFFGDIASFVPPSMQYKLPEEFRGRYAELPDVPGTPEPITVPMPVVRVEPWSRGALSPMYDTKFDIGVGDTHSYFVNDLLVHNSFQKFGVPQTSPGGHGKDYAFYVRIKLARDEWISEKRPGFPDPVVVGQVIALKTIKNKSRAPQQTAKIRAYVRDAPILGFRRGEYDLGEEFVTMGKLFGVVQVKGSWLHYAGQKWQSKDAMKAGIREDLGLQRKLAAEVLEVSADPRRADLVAQEADEKPHTGPLRRRGRQ